MKTEFKVGDRRWKLYQHDDGIRVYDVEQTIIPFGGSPPRFIAEVVEVIKPKKVKMYPALFETDEGWEMSDLLFKTESEAEEYFRGPHKFIRLLTDDHHAVEIEL